MRGWVQNLLSDEGIEPQNVSVRSATIHALCG